MKSLLVCLWLFPLALLAADLPPMVLPAGVGVNIHFTKGRQKDLDLIAAAGFRFVRMDFFWEGIERQKGQYDWSEYDALTADLEQRGLRSIYILDYSNPLFETGGASPQHPESVAAFARFAAAAALHFKGHHILWEIWNEPNGDFWKPHADAHQYASFALATCQALRAADPDCTIIGPASSGFPWEFIETFFKAGALNYLDAVSVHPYRDYDQSPETARADYVKLAGLIDQYAPIARRGHIPIISGEWGYSSRADGVTVEKQAAFLVRQQLANLLNGIPLSIWYDWKNDGPDPRENEHNFGTVLPDLSPKPAYQAVSVMTAQLTGYHIEGRVSVSDRKDYVLLLRNSKNQTKLAAWTTGKSHDLVLPLNKKNGQIELVDGHGSVSQLGVVNGSVTVPLTELPVYLNPGKLKIREQSL